MNRTWEQRCLNQSKGTVMQNRAGEQRSVSLARGAKRLMLRDARGTAGRAEQLDVP